MYSNKKARCTQETIDGNNEGITYFNDVKADFAKNCGNPNQLCLDALASKDELQQWLDSREINEAMAERGVSSDPKIHDPGVFPNVFDGLDYEKLRNYRDAKVKDAKAKGCKL
jgi:hypothetical protein